MPAKRAYETKSVHLNIRTDLHAILMDLCDATGQKPARLITDLLEHSAPQFKRLTRAARIAKTTPQAAAGVLQEMLDDALQQANVVQEGVRQMDLLPNEGETK